MRVALLLLLVSQFAFAQTPEEKMRELRLQEEQFRKAQLMRTLDSGRVLMEQGEYLLADKKFRHVLDNIKSVPSDLTYFFGKNSFQLGRYKQSIDWLNKYIQLKGTTGQYYTDAVATLQRSESSLLAMQKTEASQIAEVLSKSYDIDCGPSGKVVCPVCKGEGVIVKAGIFGNNYKTCPYCDNHGLLTCQQYNQLIRGELAERK